MINELGIQRELCQAVIMENGGFAYKQNNQFIVGVADLFVQLPQYPTVVIEVKYVKSLSQRTMTAKLDLTPHQERYIDRVQEAGGQAGWLFVARVGIGEYRITADWQTALNHSFIDFTLALHRHRGAPWPIRDIIDRVVRPSPGTILRTE